MSGAKIVDLAETLGPDWARAIALRKALCAGDSAKMRDYRVLWIGTHLALVQWQGGSYRMNGKAVHAASDVGIVTIDDPHDVQEFREASLRALVREVEALAGEPGPALGQVHDCNTKLDAGMIEKLALQGVTTGRLTPTIVATLARHAAAVDAVWPKIARLCKTQGGREQDAGRTARDRVDVAEQRILASFREDQPGETETYNLYHELREADAALAALERT